MTVWKQMEVGDFPMCMRKYMSVFSYHVGVLILVYANVCRLFLLIPASAISEVAPALTGSEHSFGTQVDFLNS